MVYKNTAEEKFSGTAEDKTLSGESSEGVGRAAPENDSSLESLVNEEQLYARRQAREELGREPTQKEIDEWLDAHTEGY